MQGMVLISFGLVIIIISCLLTYLAAKTKILRNIPALISLLGVLYFGIGPQIFNYANGITIGITFMILGIFCGIAFISSLITLMCINITKKKNEG